MRLVLAVAFGGAAGSVARYLTSRALAPVADLPLGTVVVNVVGSFVLGMLVATAPAGEPSPWRLALGVGFCGGFTTFSAFSIELLALVGNGATGRAAVYAVISVVLGVVAAFAGALAGRALGMPLGAR